MNWSNLVHILVKTKEMKKILYIDMDNVLVDFPSGVSKLSQEVLIIISFKGSLECIIANKF